MYKKILVAYDGSDGAHKALKAGINLAKIHQAELCALAVEEKLPRFSGTIDEVQEEKQFANAQYGKLLEAAKEKGKEAAIELKTLMRPGHPAQTIVAVAKEGKFDLVLVGHTGLSGSGPRFWAPLRKR
jgi:nucleotide-binding universal stress UspA family protein